MHYYMLVILGPDPWIPGSTHQMEVLWRGPWYLSYTLTTSGSTQEYLWSPLRGPETPPVGASAPCYAPAYIRCTRGVAEYSTRAPSWVHIRRYVLNELLTMDAPFMGPSWVPSYTLPEALGHLVASWSLVPS